MGQRGRHMHVFNFTRYYPTVIQNGGTNLQDQQQYVRVPVTLYPHQPLLLRLFLLIHISSYIQPVNVYKNQAGILTILKCIDQYAEKN